MVGRVIVLVTAVLVAALGALLVFLYTQNTINDARRQLEPVEVLVANQEIAAGTTVQAAQAAGQIVLVDRPRDALPEGAVTGEEFDDVAAQTAATALYRGEVLVRSRLQDPEAGGQALIEPSELAITLPLDDPNRLAPLLGEGDVVAVFLTQAATGGTPTTQLLVPRVEVIGVGAVDQAGGQADGTSNALVTVSVSQAEAQQLILGQSVGELYLALLTQGDVVSDIRTGDGTGVEDLFEESP